MVSASHSVATSLYARAARLTCRIAICMTNLYPTNSSKHALGSSHPMGAQGCTSDGRWITTMLSCADDAASRIFGFFGHRRGSAAVSARTVSVPATRVQPRRFVAVQAAAVAEGLTKGDLKKSKRYRAEKVSSSVVLDLTGGSYECKNGYCPMLMRAMHFICKK